MIIRSAKADDYDALGQLMFNAIHVDPSPYTKTERLAWRRAPHAGAEWYARLEEQHVFIAEDANGPVGFLTLAPDGYVDLAYMLPRGRGRGVFRQLHNCLEDAAQRNGTSRLYTHASLSAEGPFKAMGYRVTEREIVSLNGEQLRRAAMEKSL
ncbi:GNAT family N-acetyltransferase [Algimonas porphyrae]|uniref:Acetyltransferase n=1 Tax=Algimonas porphyrae TaxID=1128113 RepID=A0ABQ5V2E5_9PROT|nr:GNAT family N-acetyltransferase [Algimonas porphyrae]GLQ21114.1 acetyltransferase [Algimonas porphyrae]